MKKSITLIITLGLTIGLFTGCGKSEPKEVELTVFAAASMTETMEEIAELYKAEQPNVYLYLILILPEH